jgi:acetyl-CoA synthetase
MAVAEYSWDEAASWLDGLPDGRGLNIAHEAVDRHATGPRADRVALRFLNTDDSVADVTYADLRHSTNRVANAITSLGLAPGDRVFTLLGRVPELYDTALGALKARAMFCPMFSAFGPDPIRQRIERGDGRLLVTTAAMYRKKIAPIRDSLPMLEHVLIVDGEPLVGTASFRDVVGAMPTAFDIGPTDPEDPALLHFTSGTTGTPKGAVHVHGAVVAHQATARWALDLRPDDTFWCTADPGWVTGTSYGIIAPLTNGATTIVDRAEFDARRWYRILQEQQVDVWYTSPTALRMLMRAGDDLPNEYDLSALRFVASVGEPLNPEVVEWSRRVLGAPAHDNWWQTETGGIMIANAAGQEVRSGSMGRPPPGINTAIAAVDD